MRSRHAIVIVLLSLAGCFALAASAAERATARLGDLEMHCVALPTMELTPEAAQGFNVTREPQRGLLTVTLFRHAGEQGAQTLSGQVFAGAINPRNTLFNIPVREVREGDAVYYLGEFHVAAPDTLRFLVNASVGGKPLNADFTRSFNTP